MKKLLIHMVFLASPALAWAQQGYSHGPGMMWGSNGWWGFGMGPWLPLLVLVVLVALVAWLAKRLRQSTPKGSPTIAATDNTASLSRLEKQFSRGEIDEAEFNRRRQALHD